MALSPYDQSVYDAGFKYIPQSRYLLNPFQIPQGEEAEGNVAPGLPAIYQAQGGDGFNPYNTDMSNIRQDYNAFPSRQAGEIYSKTFNPGPNPYATSMYGGSLPRAQSQYNLANQNISLTGPMTPERRAEIMRTTDDIIQDNRMKYATEGQYIDQYDPNYSSMTEAQKFMDNYPEYYGVPSGVPEPGIPGAIKNYMSNSLIGKGFGMAKDFLGRVMPINERAIMENEARGAGIFTDDIGRIVTDDYNTAGGIMAGYNLNKIDADTFGKRRDTIEKTIADKKAKGLDTTTLEERLGLLDDAEAQILGARKKTKQVYKMRKDKKAADKKRKEDAAAAAAAAEAAAAQAERDRVAQVQSRLDSGSYVSRDSGGYSASDRAVGGGREATNAQGQNAAQATAAGTGTSQGYSQHYMDGGRVYYMDGGLADMLEIYD